jgi:hypothetical protein
MKHICTIHIFKLHLVYTIPQETNSKQENKWIPSFLRLGNVSMTENILPG